MLGVLLLSKAGLRLARTIYVHNAYDRVFEISLPITC
jgi:hypothetical protein